MRVLFPGVGVAWLPLLLGVACTSPPEAGTGLPNVASSGSGGAGLTQGGVAQGAASGMGADSGGLPATGGAAGTTSEAAGSGGAAAMPAEVSCAASPPGEVVFLPPSGTFQDSVTVTLSSGLANAELRYTTDYLDVAVLGFEPSQGATSLSSLPSLATQGAFHVRGQSSSRYDKRPYRLELRQAGTADRDCPMFGMPSEAWLDTQWM